MLITFLAGVFLLPGVAWDDKPVESANPEGRFGKFEQSGGAAAHVYHDDSGWHIRFRGNATQTTRFQGKFFIDQEVPQLRGGQKEKNDKLTRIPNGFAFDYRTGMNGNDAIDFHTPKGYTRVTFEIKIQGNDNPKRIFIGSKGAHPKTAIFSLPAQPAK